MPVGNRILEHYKSKTKDILATNRALTQTTVFKTAGDLREEKRFSKKMQRCRTS